MSVGPLVSVCEGNFVDTHIDNVRVATCVCSRQRVVRHMCLSLGVYLSVESGPILPAYTCLWGTHVHTRLHITKPPLVT